MRYLGIDFGLRRVGLATSEGNLASPYKVIRVKGFDDLLEKIKKESASFDRLVVGMPEGKMSLTVLKFMNVLKKAGFDVVEADETLSSQNATSRMVEENLPKEKRKVKDAYSAAIILQNYLDQR